MILEAIKRTFFFSIFFVPFFGLVVIALIDPYYENDFTRTINEFARNHPNMAIGWHICWVIIIILPLFILPLL